MILPSILDFLAQRIGLDAQSIGLPNIEDALQERMRERHVSDMAAYRELLLKDDTEQEALIEQIVVPETWFFRDQSPFDFLAVHASKQWGEFSAAAPLRILSLPCSTGEEPYSIAMTLIDAGHPAESFHIDAVDVSCKALQRARAAVYQKNDFRGKNLDVLLRHFRETSPDVFTLNPQVRDTVSFSHGTLLHIPFPEIPGSYHAIFCRNLLIYLNQSWRERALETFQKLLRPDGILFIGHADASTALSTRFTMVRNAAAFAYYPKGATPRPRPSASKPKHANTATPIIPPKPSLASILHEMQSAIDREDGATAQALGQIALEHTRNNAELYYLLGAAQELQNHPEEAKDLWQKSLYLVPQHLNSLHRLKCLLEKQGDHAAASRLQKRIQRAKSVQRPS